MGGGAPLDVGEDGEPRAKGEPELPYKKENILGMMKARGGWLTIFGVGVSTARVATIISLSASIFGFASFSVLSWLMDRFFWRDFD